MQSLPFFQKNEQRYTAKTTEIFSVHTPLESNNDVQGGCSDGKTLHCDPDSFQNSVAAYRWNGEFVGMIDFDIGPREPENICSHKGKLLLVAGDEGTMRCYEFS